MDNKEWNVLLVDDEVEFITTLAERLELRGITPRITHDGQSALKAVAENEPRILVLDIMMPGMNGLEVLQRVREEYPAIQVILLTGQGKTRDGIEGMRLGAFAYLMKPLDLEDLMRTMNEALLPGQG